jgi:hypothetical protein
VLEVLESLNRGELQQERESNRRTRERRVRVCEDRANNFSATLTLRSACTALSSTSSMHSFCTVVYSQYFIALQRFAKQEKKNDEDSPLTLLAVLRHRRLVTRPAQLLRLIPRYSAASETALPTLEDGDDGFRETARETDLLTFGPSASQDGESGRDKVSE